MTVEYATWIDLRRTHEYSAALPQSPRERNTDKQQMFQMTLQRESRAVPIQRFQKSVPIQAFDIPEDMRISNEMLSLSKDVRQFHAGQKNKLVMIH